MRKKYWKSSAWIRRIAAAVSLLLLFGTAQGAAAGSLSIDGKEALKRYRDYLSRDTIYWTGTEGTGVPVTEQMKFMTEDLNGDGIPELLVKNTEDIYGLIEIYTCGEFGVNEVTSCDELGVYYPGTPVFTEPVRHTIIYENYLYLVGVPDANASWRLKVGEICNYDTGTEYYWYGVYEEDTADEWYDNGATPLSEAEFQAKLDELTGGAERTELSEDDWHDNTAENRQKYLS